MDFNNGFLLCGDSRNLIPTAYHARPGAIPRSERGCLAAHYRGDIADRRIRVGGMWIENPKDIDRASISPGRFALEYGLCLKCPLDPARRHIFLGRLHIYGIQWATLTFNRVLRVLNPIRQKLLGQRPDFQTRPSLLNLKIGSQEFHRREETRFGRGPYRWCHPIPGISRKRAEALSNLVKLI